MMGQIERTSPEGRNVAGCSMNPRTQDHGPGASSLVFARNGSLGKAARESYEGNIAARYGMTFVTTDLGSRLLSISRLPRIVSWIGAH